MPQYKGDTNLLTLPPPAPKMGFQTIKRPSSRGDLHPIFPLCLFVTPRNRGDTDLLTFAHLFFYHEIRGNKILAANGGVVRRENREI